MPRGRYGGHNAKEARQEKQLNQFIKKQAKKAKRGMWLERKHKKRLQPKRTLKDYGADE